MRCGYKNIWHIAYPILFAIVMENLIGMTDTAFLGRVGEVELGASALGGVYYISIFVVGFGFSVGSQILISRRNGERRHAAIGPIMIQGTIFLVALAAALFAATRAFAPHVMRGLVSSPEICAAAVEYLNWRIFGVFFIFAAVMFRAFFVGIAQTRILTINSVVMVGCNVLLNYVLIFGKFGFPKLGIAGAAIASSISELVSLLFFAWYVWSRVDLEKYGLNRFSGVNPKVVGKILSVSVWTMLQYLFGIVTWFFFFIAVEHLGERPLAVSNIARSVSAIVLMPVFAFGSTASTIAGNLMGEGRPELVMKACAKVVKLCYMVLLPLIALMMLFPREVLGIYTDNADLVSASVPTLYVTMLAALVTIPGCVLLNAVSGTGNTRAALGLEVCVLLVYTAYVFAVIVGLKPDVAVCWTTEFIYWGCMMIFAWTYLKKADWRAKKI